MEEQKISLKQSGFDIFAIFFSQTMIIGAIITSFIDSFIPEIVVRLIYVGIFAFALYRGITALKSNDRTLVVTDSTLMMKEKVKNLEALIFKVDNPEVARVEMLEEELYGIKKTNGDTFPIALTYSLKTSRALDLEVRTMLYKKYGEKADAIFTEDVDEYIRTGNMPIEVQKASKDKKSTDRAYAILGIIFAAIPAFYAFMCAIWVALKALSLMLP